MSFTGGVLPINHTALTLVVYTCIVWLCTRCSNIVALVVATASPGKNKKSKDAADL